ncbi:type I restriction enzyme HsdR N-terminal domain-containing protein [Chryseolinea sp. H1M3-3]|uniref:type I restriction enzyme HsdR N-terminal domain-containing protein n=1 Tax=Chryseolinea sp. H1M3-3 TaxID=3034144 RepID=UPI0023EC4D0B|nr:type I restriction enzyme HsdR N-terminal domain-containing protein [Chryseolinea sp. H1M3-3]
MVKLNLPAIDVELKRSQDKIFIFDFLRKRFVVLTPEEWVRQHFLHYLINDLKYPRSLIKVEGGLMFNTLQKRSDIVVFDRQGAPWMVIECKAPELKLSSRTIQQASTYNYSLRAKYIVITNGMSSICCETDWTNSRTVVLETMPAYDQL